MTQVFGSFVGLGLNSYILNALQDLGYQSPSYIQYKCIPSILMGRDVLGVAQTGSGKTAAFALPLLHNVNTKLITTQVLILTPTRELAIQVSEVCSNFSKYIKNINIIALYGGQGYNTQLRSLKRGVQIVVGTPGRLLDHLRRGTLNLSKLNSLVLDEADEMLRMGFIEDVKSILTNIPVKHQTILFSATLPISIRHIINDFMNKPKKVLLRSNSFVCPDIKQYYCLLYGCSKSEVLMRFLEIEKFDAVIVFVRTKISTVSLSNILRHYGYNSSPLNGDMNQTLRQQTLSKFREGLLSILIATDVAARGLDVDRVSLVINYDTPLSSEMYIHRIGRTGRAGRIGKSLLLVECNEYRLLRNIENNIGMTISKIDIPSSKELCINRIDKFSLRIRNILKHNDLDSYHKLLSKIQSQNNLDIKQLATVLLKMAQGNRPLVISSDHVFAKYYREKKKFTKSKCNVLVKYKKYNVYTKKKLKKNMLSSYRI